MRRDEINESSAETLQPLWGEKHRAQFWYSCSVLPRYWGLLGGQSTIKRQGLSACQEY